MLELRDIDFAYSAYPSIFKNFSWRVKHGEIWAVLGPSGCGKTTLLMLLSALEHPQSGQIFVDGEVLRRPRPHSGLILQDYGLLPWATVRDNVMLGLRIRGFYGPDGRHVPLDARMDARSAVRRVDHWLERLGIADLADQYPGQISGGQRQRAAIARTFVLGPDLLLMDEPFSALDAPTREQLQVLTLSLCAEAHLTAVLITHNIEEAAFVGQKILLLGAIPNSVPQIIENRHAVAADSKTAYRMSSAYQKACAQLRERVGQ